MAMDISDILHQLEHFKQGVFPRQALREAIARREAITPALLDVFRHPEDTLNRLIGDEEYMLPIYALFLLAQFRETQAYPLIVDFFSLPGEQVVDVTGDVVTEDLARILASVSGGDTSLMHRLAENPQVSEWTRGAALDALVTLVAAGDLPREEAVEYYRSLFNTFPRTPGLLWSLLISSCCDIYPEEVLPEIRQAFRDKLPEEEIAGFDWVEEVMQRGKGAVLADLRANRHNQLVGDTIRELEWWAAFKPPQPQSRTPFKAPQQPAKSPPPKLQSSQAGPFFPGPQRSLLVRQRQEVQAVPLAQGPEQMKRRP